MDAYNNLVFNSQKIFLRSTSGFITLLGKGPTPNQGPARSGSMSHLICHISVHQVCWALTFSPSHEGAMFSPTTGPLHMLLESSPFPFFVANSCYMSLASSLCWLPWPPLPGQTTLLYTYSPVLIFECSCMIHLINVYLPGYTAISRQLSLSLFVLITCPYPQDLVQAWNRE